MRRRGVFLFFRRYSLVTHAGYVPRDDDTPAGAGGGSRAPLASAARRERGRPPVSRCAHGLGTHSPVAAPRTRERAGDERLAGDPTLRPPLRLDVGMGSRGGRVRRGADDLRHARLVFPGAALGRAPGARRRDLSHRVRPQMAAAAGGVPGRAPGGDPERRVRPVGDLRADPVFAELYRPAAAGRARLDPVPERRLLRQLPARRRRDPGDHDRALYRRGLPGGAAGRPRQPARGGAGYGCDPVGGRLDRGGPLRTRRADRRRDPRPGPRAGRDDGGDDADREPARHRPVGAAARLHHGRGDRQRVQRSHYQPLPLGTVRSRPHPVCGHRRGQRPGAPLDLARRPRHGLVSGSMTALVAVLSFVAVLALVLILGHLVAKGASSLDWSFFVRNPVPAGQSGGGVANAIVGTVIIVGLAALIGLPIGIGTGLYLAEYGSGRLGWIVRFVADVLNGTPSIVVGIFAWTWLVRPMGHFSALAGSVALAVLIVPMIARTTEEMVRLVPHSLREAALALGYPRWRTSLRIIARTALAGILTGCLVGVARIAGETAPLLFTALGNLNFSTSILQPMQTLSLQIFTYGTGPFDEWHRLAWAAALVLMGLVLVLALAARWAVRSRHGAAR